MCRPGAAREALDPDVTGPAQPAIRGAAASALDGGHGVHLCCWRGGVMNHVAWVSVLLGGLIGGLLIGRWRGDPLVHNERVKLFATALNNLGVAALAYGLIAPAVIPGATHAVTISAATLGVVFVGFAQCLLGWLRSPPKS